MVNPCIYLRSSINYLLHIHIISLLLLLVCSTLPLSLGFFVFGVSVFGFSVFGVSVFGFSVFGFSVFGGIAHNSVMTSESGVEAQLK